MSENITHTAINDDCFHLISASPNVCEVFKTVTQDHLDIARLGAVTRSADRFTPELLRRFRDDWEVQTEKDNFEQKLAFTLGCLCHRAADRTMKPIFRRLGADDSQSPTDVSIYHDIFVFRELYREGSESPYSPAMFEQPIQSMPGSEVFSKSDVEEYFRVLMQRALLSLHTFIPDRNDIEGWLDRLFNLRQQFSVSLARYADAFYRPDPDKYRRYIVEDDFYNPQNPLIQLARWIQRGERVDPDKFTTAFESQENTSKYAQALVLGTRYLHTASQYFMGNLAFDALKEGLDIGKPGG